MQASGVRTSVVMATNSGFSGEVVNKALADAIRTITGNETFKDAPDQAIASSIDALKPARTGTTLVTQENSVSAPSTPMNKQDPTGRGM